MKKRILIVVLLMFMTFGCIKTTVDGETKYSVDPNKATEIEKGVESGITIMQALTPFFPWLGAIATGIGGGLTVWRTQKPKFIKEQSRADMYHSATSGLVAAIEKYKKEGITEAEWLNFEKILMSKIGPESENVIRALRGLPPKK